MCGDQCEWPAPEQGIAVPGTTPGQAGEKLQSLCTTNVLKHRNNVAKRLPASIRSVVQS